MQVQTSITVRHEDLRAVEPRHPQRTQRSSLRQEPTPRVTNVLAEYKLERDPVATGSAKFGQGYVFKDPTVALNGPSRGDIGVLAYDEHTTKSQRASFGQYRSQRPLSQTSPASRWTYAIADVPTCAKQKVVERAPKADSAKVLVVVNDPPVVGIDPAFFQKGRRVRLQAQALHPRSEPCRGVDVITDIQTSTILVRLPTPFITGR